MLSGRHESPYDTLPEEVINCAKSDVCTPDCFGGFKTDRQNCSLQYRLKAELQNLKKYFQSALIIYNSLSKMLISYVTNSKSDVN